MSYEIYFIKKDDLDLDNVYPILEAEDVNQDDEFFISKDLMINIKNSLSEKGLKFETFEGTQEDYFELNFPLYQVSMFNSQIVISLPYWDENSNEGINKEIKFLTNTFLENGLTGFDPQTEEFVTQTYEFQEIFTETKSEVDRSIIEENSSNSNAFIIGGIGLGILIIGFIIWKWIKK